MLLGYNHYQDWQKKNAPHSIWGINDPPAYLSGDDKTNWEIGYVKNWVLNYNQEYSFFLAYYDSVFRQAHLPMASAEENQHRKFLLTWLNKIEARAPHVMSILHEDKVSTLPDPVSNLSALLRDAPEEFIEQIYKDLLMRKPTNDEKAGLLKIIQENPGVTPEIIYYSLMTSEEYKYY
jgi:hypothetical protein